MNRVIIAAQAVLAAAVLTACASGQTSGAVAARSADYVYRAC